jgi:hypothetical protein
MVRATDLSYYSCIQLLSSGQLEARTVPSRIEYNLTRQATDSSHNSGIQRLSSGQTVLYCPSCDAL